MDLKDPEPPPFAEGRRWLLDKLGTLLAHAGWQRFVLGEVLEPTDTFFPDRFVPGPEGVATVARRLLWWAGVSGLDVAVVENHGIVGARAAARSPIPAALGGPMPLAVPAGGSDGWDVDLADLDDGTMTVVVGAKGLPQELPGALVHLVALVVRQRQLQQVPPGLYRGLEAGAEDEELASLQTLELGFGLLATEATERVGVAAAHTWERFQVPAAGHGALSLAEMACLLAVQTSVRGTDARTLKRWERYLRPAQLDLFRRWRHALRDQDGVLRAHLGIPAPARWPTVPAPRVAVPF